MDRATRGELETVEEIAAGDHHLAVVSTVRPDGAVQSSVVNAGIVPHPISEAPVLGFVTYGRVKLANLRSRPRATVVFRAGWRWVAVEGRCDVVGPDDPLPGVEPSALPALLREVFRAAGGEHGDWDEYDRVMASQRRAAVFVHPEHVYSNSQTSG